MARKICLAFNVSQSMNLLKHLQCLCFIKFKSYLILVSLPYYKCIKPVTPVKLFFKKGNYLRNFFSQKDIHKSIQQHDTQTLRENCPNTEFFLVRIQSKCGKIRSKKSFVFGHFSRSETMSLSIKL